MRVSVHGVAMGVFLICMAIGVVSFFRGRPWTMLLLLIPASIALAVYANTAPS